MGYTTWGHKESDTTFTFLETLHTPLIEVISGKDSAAGVGKRL